jgi:uridine phosphorylase
MQDNENTPSDDYDMSPPLLRAKRYSDASLFVPENLLREARRQKALPEARVPAICVLDPDGDIVRHLVATGQAHPDPAWACYHTTLYNAVLDEIVVGIVGCAVGASFAVLVAEELFASGCELLISVTSSGQIAPADHAPPYFVLIEKALRDEGTSYHYLPPTDYAYLADDLQAMFAGVFASAPVPVYRGATWTTDAPFRETAHAVAQAQAAGIAAVEMEAAALYAFAAACRRAVVCFAHVTNQMGTVDNDFEKGDAGGVYDALAVIQAAAVRWCNQEDQPGDAMPRCRPPNAVG